jgi:hypothetical protein
MSAFTKEQADEMQRRVEANSKPLPEEEVIRRIKAGIPVPLPSIPMVGGVVAKANLAPRDRGMNKTEAKFSHRLETMKRNGLIADWRFEPVKFRLADMTTYTPDFLTIDMDGVVTLIDTKAYWAKAGKVGVTEDANVKMKVVAEQYPWFTFQMWWEQKGEWKSKTY